MQDPITKALGAYQAGDPNQPQNTDYDRALAAAAQALDAGLANFALHNVTWHIRYLRQDYAGALEDLKRALALQPDAPQAHYHVGLVREHLGETELARGAFLRAQELAAAAGDEDLVDAIDHHL
jgi:tetratricopeptide (TPR) repeat protein